jgi:hypothetical protein
MLPLAVSALPLQSTDSGAVVFLLFQLLLAAVQLAGMWMVFKTAGHAGWKAHVPIYNFYFMLQIGENAWWWLALAFTLFGPESSRTYCSRIHLHTKSVLCLRVVVLAQLVIRTRIGLIRRHIIIKYPLR